MDFSRVTVERSYCVPLTVTRGASLNISFASCVRSMMDWRRSSRARLNAGYFLLTAMLFFLTPLHAFAAVSVTISPTSVNLTPSATQQFTATVTGASDTSVVWTIQEGAAGGSVTGAGLYSAPGVVGVYHVVATSNADPTQSATATVGVPGFVQSGLLNPGPCSATQFSNGTILYTTSTAAEIYNPATESSLPTGAFVAVRDAVSGNLIVARCFETATLLPNGKILFAGGQLGGGGQTATAELYDPVAGTFSLTGSMSVARVNHTATLLPNGTVLITGGANCNSSCVFFNTAEIYDPGSGLFTPTPGVMVVAAELSSATLLANGKVLIAGGATGGSAGTTIAELYDLSTGMFTQTGSMGNGRSQNFTATLLQDGTVLFAGGLVNGAVTSTAEIYDPTTQQFSPTGSPGEPLSGHTATLLANGQVLIAGGWFNPPPTVAQLYDPVARTFKSTGSLQEARFGAFATLVANGTVVVAGGNLPGALGSIEVYDPVAGTFSSNSTFMKIARTGNTMTKLADGRFLFIGGLDINQDPALSAEIYDPATNKFTLTGALSVGRQMHTATLLGDGTVLVVGGFAGLAHSTFVSTAEVYNPASGTFGPAPSNPTVLRAGQTATVLTNGKILIAGGLIPLGVNGYTATTSVELYDPSAGSFVPAGNMTAPRANHTATLLSDGRVLLAEGVYDPISFSTGAKYAPDELYDPSSGTFTPVGAPELFASQISPQPFDSLQWPSGQVLVDYVTVLDPSSLSLSNFDSHLGSSITNSYKFSILPSGQVFMAGGATLGIRTFLLNLNPPLLPQEGPTYLPAGNMQYARTSPSLALLPNGEVMIAGGTEIETVNTNVNQVEFYLPPVPAASPVITGVSPNPLTGFNPVPITVQGANFTSGSVITLDFAPLPTTIVSTTQLTATIPAITLTGPGTHTIQVQNSDLNSAPFTVTVNNPRLSVSQPSGSGLTYVNIPVGTSSSQSVSFGNVGNIPLTIDSLSITGANSADFKFDMANTNCPLQGGALAAQQSCTATVLFVPASDGQFTAALNLAYESLPGSPFVVPLSGTGSGQVSATVNPTSVAFGSQGVGTGSQPQSVTIVSTGNPNLQFVSVVLTDTTDFSMTNQCSGNLGPNSSCSIAITFMPSKTGSISGSLVITTNEVTPFTIPLSGTGETFSISLASGSSSSATVAAGHTATYQLSIAPQSFSGPVTLTCAPVTAIPNATCSVAPNPATLSGMSATVVTVSVMTTARSGLSIPSLAKRYLGPGAYPLRSWQWLFYLLLSLALAASFKFRRRVPLALSAMLLLAVLAAGCASSGGSSGGGGSMGTPAGTYQLVVTASASGISSNTTLTIVVQ